MNDGALQNLRDKYDTQLAWIQDLGLEKRSSRNSIIKDLDAAYKDIDSVLDFVHSGMYVASRLTCIVHTCLCFQCYIGLVQSMMQS